MDIVVKKRKHAESLNNETSQSNVPDGIPATRDQSLIAGSSNSFRERPKNARRTEYAQSTMVNEDTSMQKHEDKKFVDYKGGSVDTSLVDRLRNIKQESFKRSSIGISSLRDEQISDNTFVESVRVLDDAFNVTPTGTRTSNSRICSLGLVPFVMLERCNKKLELKNDRRSTEHWSLDEENEEDIFSDSQDDTENVVEFSQWQYATDRSPDESFCGFSPGQIQSSRDIVVMYSQRDPIDIESDDDTLPLQGFSSVQQHTSKRLADKWKHRIESSSFDRSFVEDSVARNAPDTKKVARIIDDYVVAARSGTSIRRILDAQSGKPRGFLSTAIECTTKKKQDYCKPGDLPGFKTVPKLSAPSTSTCGFSTAGGRPINVSEAALAKARTIYSDEISIAEDESRDFVSEDLPESRNSPKLETHKPSSCGFSTAGGRAINVSESAVIKAQRAYLELDDCDAGPRTGKAVAARTAEAMSRENATVGFTTAKGNPMRISAAALSRAKDLYDQEASTADTPLASKNFNATTKIHDTEQSSLMMRAHTAPNFDNVEEKTRSTLNARVGFTTAKGSCLKISAEALSRAKDLYDQEASIVDTTIATKNFNSTTERRDTGKISSTIGAQTANIFDNIESINFDDFVDPVEDDEASRKRKLDEVDDVTPMRRDGYCNPKRGRYVNELQARKLFLEDSGTEDDAPTTITKSESAESGSRDKLSTTVSPEKTLITDEVFASAAALLEDEERSNEGSLWKIGKSSSTEIQKEPEIVIAHKKSTSPKLIDPENLQGVNGSCPSVPSPSSNRPARMERNSLDIQPESIPDDLTFETQFSQDTQYYPLMDTFINETMKIMEARLAMTCKQDETIRSKRRTKQQPLDGFLYKLRTSNRDSRISWRELTKGAAPAPREISNGSLESDVLSVTSTSAASYSFRCADLFGSKYVGIDVKGIKVGDDAFLILDENNRAGVREFERAFLAMPGVDPNLVPTGWVKNHYRWIVWKLASMDRVDFGHKCLPRMLTPDRVMFELKYRYDREIYRTQWPPLRRILERNEDASARIVLCVASITVTEENSNVPVRGATTPNLPSGPSYKIKLTDGWYSIAACIDAAMINCIKTGKVKEGTKLMTIGAKTLNLDQGCSALEIPLDVSLRIHTNSTRRTKWYTKLDYYHINRGPMLLSLKSIKPNGGMICKLVVAVARLYPILYREKMPDGQFVFRNARRDEEAALAYESQHQAKMDEIYANARKEFQMRLMNRKEHDKTRNRMSVEQMASSYSELEEELRQSITSKLRECLPPPRDVTPVMKIRIAEGETSAILTVWSSDRDTTEIFVEGSSVAIYNAFASRPRLNELHITANSSSFMKRETKRRIYYPERIFTSLTDIAEPGFNPVYGEFDTVGIVSSVGPAPHGMKNFETVNLACPRAADCSASSFLSVLFWQGVSTHGYSKILTVGSLVACSNLEWRRNTAKSIPTAYCTERSVFTKNPRQRHLLGAFEDLRGQIQEPSAYALACAAVIEEEIAKKSVPRTPGNGTPYRPAMTSNLTPGWTPRDFGNSTNPSCTPGTDSKKESTNRRLKKLENYGEPPKLPSIVINHGSRKVLSDFRSPVVTPVTKS